VISTLPACAAVLSNLQCPPSAESAVHACRDEGLPVNMYVGYKSLPPDGKVTTMMHPDVHSSALLADVWYAVLAVHCTG
jgi:hypothetical protein